jgi:hypothetical protein
MNKHHNPLPPLLPDAILCYLPWSDEDLQFILDSWTLQFPIDITSCQVAIDIDYELSSSFPLSKATGSFALAFQQAKTT